MTAIYRATAMLVTTLMAGCAPGFMALPEATEALRENGIVIEDRGGFRSFVPMEGARRQGLIFYPGALVEPVAYAPLARAVAETGFPAAVVRFPFRLAVFDPDRADRVIEAFGDTVTDWVIAGHSLGGAMAARYVNGLPDDGAAVAGLLLLAAFPGDADDLSDTDLCVVSLFGTNDGIATPQEVQGAAPLLPPGARFVAIEGGNHAQFGFYGPQPGDNPAAISRSEQQAIVVDEIVGVLEKTADRR